MQTSKTAQKLYSVDLFLFTDPVFPELLAIFSFIETFPDLLKTVSLFCFCLPTCLLSLFKSLPRQGGLIGTRDFGLAGADLEINGS